MIDLLSGGADRVAGDLVCSAKGCGEQAAWGLLWNNPRIHTPERRKVWLACDGHREHLEQFLGARSFWKQTVPVENLEHE
jgi:3',5'-cyclic AMP phosphodiesterase CpdA